MEWILRKIFFWETDDKKIGNLIRLCHHSFMYFLFTLIIISHTLVSNFLLLLIIYIVLVCIWFQHMIFHGCVLSQVEQKLLGDSRSFIDPFLEAFHIPITPETTVGITIMGSTCLVIVFGLEVFSRGLQLIFQVVEQGIKHNLISPKFATA